MKYAYTNVIFGVTTWDPVELEKLIRADMPVIGGLANVEFEFDEEALSARMPNVHITIRYEAPRPMISTIDEELGQGRTPLPQEVSSRFMGVVKGLIERALGAGMLDRYKIQITPRGYVADHETWIGGIVVSVGSEMPAYYVEKLAHALDTLCVNDDPMFFHGDKAWRLGDGDDSGAVVMFDGAFVVWVRAWDKEGFERG